MDGDCQRDRRFHGGPDRALSLYSLERIESLQSEGHPTEPGAIGENVTVAGVDWPDMTPGRRVLLGEVEIELTSYAAPCKTIRNAFLDQDFTRIAEAASRMESPVRPRNSRRRSARRRSCLNRVESGISLEVVALAPGPEIVA